MKICLIYNLIILGLDKIEFLQSHDNIEVYQKSFDIIETFFSQEDETALQPSVQGDEFSFISNPQMNNNNNNNQNSQMFEDQSQQFHF